MKTREILNIVEHRPWKLPNESWKFYQEWNNAIFLHWQVELSELQKFVPKELKIDLFEGKPWVSIVAFTMEKMRRRNLPSFSPISNFDEINIRTYVKSKDQKTGVYFLSIEGGNHLSCKIAKAISELPYRFSKIDRTKDQFNSNNLEFNDQLDIKFSIGKRLVSKSELDIWLTERYALFQDSNSTINEFEIHHLEWQLNKIEISSLKFNYKRFNKLLIGEPDKIQYSKGVNVIAWGRNKREKKGYDII